jgi:hypothetical protein
VAKTQSEYYFKLVSAVAIEQKLRLAKNVSALSENELLGGFIAEDNHLTRQTIHLYNMIVPISHLANPLC